MFNSIAVIPMKTFEAFSKIYNLPSLEFSCNKIPELTASSESNMKLVRDFFESCSDKKAVDNATGVFPILFFSQLEELCNLRSGISKAKSFELQAQRRDENGTRRRTWFLRSIHSQLTRKEILGSIKAFLIPPTCWCGHANLTDRIEGNHQCYTNMAPEHLNDFILVRKHGEKLTEDSYVIYTITGQGNGANLYMGICGTLTEGHVCGLREFDRDMWDEVSSEFGTIVSGLSDAGAALPLMIGLTLGAKNDPAMLGANKKFLKASFGGLIYDDAVKELHNSLGGKPK